eukprot:INCI12210.2.p1 GENE.INCI12210.2~~INCI12210.2.p1  ORF type:complete len:255 (+),score=53.75 INCI12210.2:226-990(+)
MLRTASAVIAAACMCLQGNAILLLHGSSVGSLQQNEAEPLPLLDKPEVEEVNAPVDIDSGGFTTLGVDSTSASDEEATTAAPGEESLERRVQRVEDSVWDKGGSQPFPLSTVFGKVTDFTKPLQADPDVLGLFRGMSLEDVDREFASYRSKDAGLLQTIQASHPELVAHYQQMVAEVAAKGKILDVMAKYLREERVRVASQCPVPHTTTLAEVAELQAKLALCETGNEGSSAPSTSQEGSVPLGRLQRDISNIL